MNEQTPISPPPIPNSHAKPKSRWRGLKIAAGIVLGAVLVFRFLGSVSSSIGLELTRKYSDGTVVELINVGSAPIKINNVTINDRPDCKVGLFTLVGDSKSPFPAELKIGDKLELWSPTCRIIRANVETDNGSRTYSFGGN